MKISIFLAILIIKNNLGNMKNKMVQKQKRPNFNHKTTFNQIAKDHW